MADESRRDVVQTGSRVTVRGDLWTVDASAVHADCEAVRLLGASASNAGSTRTVLRPFDRVVPVESGRAPRIVRTRAWNRRVLAAVARTRPFGSIVSAASAKIEILPFQLEPALAFLRHGHTRVLIADDVGLGKTIQAGLLLNALAAEDAAFRGIVLAPASLLDQWSDELRERFRLDAILADARWLSSQSRTLPADVNPWSLPGAYVASIDLVKRPEVLRSLEDVTWDLIVLDEAHTIGTATARHAAAHGIATRSRRVLLLTATPPDGDPPQLAALLATGALGDSIVQFRRSRADAGQRSERHTVLLHVRLSAAERRMHRLLERYTAMVWAETRSSRDSRARLTATLLRKRALSSASSLASSVQRRLALLAGAEPRDDGQLMLPLGEDDVTSDDVSDSVLGAPGFGDRARERAVLSRLEQLAVAAARSESKVNALVRLLRRVREPAIVFTEYRDTLRHLESTLRESGRPSVLLHGGMVVRERAEAIARFHERGTLLLATDAASEGLNLQRRCRLVVHFELPWTPARLEQRTGRVDRLGQQRAVHEVLLIARDTAERMVLLPLLRRAGAAARSGGRRSQALLAVTESIVAAGVIGGEPIAEPAAAPRPGAPFWRFSAEGEVEAARLNLHRRLSAYEDASRREDAVLIAVGRSTSPASVLVVAQVVLRNAAGRPLHSELVPLAAHTVWDGHRKADKLRRFVQDFIGRRWPSLLRVVAFQTNDALTRAREQHANVAARLQRRDRAILQGLPSAARRLVQAGLFDNRAVNAREKKRRVVATLLEEAGARADADARTAATEADIQLLAVRLGTRG